jgi:hypothetical protein
MEILDDLPASLRTDLLLHSYGSLFEVPRHIVHHLGTQHNRFQPLRDICCDNTCCTSHSRKGLLEAATAATPQSTYVSPPLPAATRERDSFGGLVCTEHHDFHAA